MDIIYIPIWPQETNLNETYFAECEQRMNVIKCTLNALGTTSKGFNWALLQLS